MFYPDVDQEEDEDEDVTGDTAETAGPADLMPGARAYHFLSEVSHWKKKRNHLVKTGTVYHAYYPALIFGPSPRVGLTVSQVRLMMGLTRELTRARTEPTGRAGKGTKPQPDTPRRVDNAEVIDGAMVHPSGTDDRRIPCRLLDAGRRYVVFGGNLHSHRGRGYRIVNPGRGCWLAHAGYHIDDSTTHPWPKVRAFLDDLAVLAGKFDLVPVGRHHGRRAWKSLAEMRACLDSGSGQDWLSECTLRVFTPAGYLVRWRYFFAKSLGFRWIPGGEDCPFEQPTPEGSGTGEVQDRIGLRKWLKERGMTEQQLAEQLGVSRETVSRHVSGRHNSPRFWKTVQKYIRSKG